MKRILLALTLLSMTAITAAEVDPTIYGLAWKEACKIVDGGCENVPAPKVVWAEGFTNLQSDEIAPAGGYDGDRIVYLEVGMADEEVYGNLIHEYTHHILHHNGKAVIVEGDVRSICRSERRAYYVSNKWLKDNELKHLRIRDWKRFYPHCK